MCRTLRTSMLALAIALAPGSARAAEAPKADLNGGGAVSVAPLMEKWELEYGRLRGIRVDYSALGSSAGGYKMLEAAIHFAVSDRPLTEEQLKTARAKNGEVVYVPLALTAVVPIYNLPGLKRPLRLSGPVLADIYLDKIRNWNDEKIQELNPGVELPLTPIVAVHRADPTSTTFVFTRYLSGASRRWKESVGAEGKTEIRWEGGEGEKGNDGMARHVGENRGAVGYVELTYALAKDLPTASVRNKAGKDIQPSVASVVTAGEAIGEIPDNLLLDASDSGAAGAYPICNVVYGVCYARGHDAARARMLGDFLRWASFEGQAYCEELHYARLPAAVSANVAAKLKIGAAE